MLSKLKQFKDEKYAKIDKVYFKKGHTEVRFTQNVYPTFKKLVKYLPFIKKLVKETNNKYKHLNIKDDEFEEFIYYEFLYFLMHWDMLNFSEQTQWCNWVNFRKAVDEYVKEEDIIVLNFVRNIEVFEEYLRKNKKNKIITVNKNLKGKLLRGVIGLSLGIYLIFRLLIKRLIRKNVDLHNKEVLLLTDYKRYYNNHGFFNEYLLKDKEFFTMIKKLFNVNIKKSIRFYTRYEFINFGYLASLKHDKKNLFLEDLLDLKIGLKLLFLKNPKLETKKFVRDEKDWNKIFIIKMYEDFLKNKFSFMLWLFLSTEKFLKENPSFKLIVGDSEKHNLFYIMNIYKKIKNPKLKTLALSHEVITEDYFYIPLNKMFDDTPDYKFVWSESLKKFLIEKFNYPPNKLKVFIDPRFLKWKYKKMLKRSILIISQGYVSLYEKLISYLKNSKEIKEILKKGGKIYFKPHPAELSKEGSKKYINILKNKFKDKIKVITNLDFVPEFALGKDSTLLYELYLNGTKVFFINSKNTFKLDKENFNKMNKKSLEDVLKEINKKLIFAN